VLARASRAPTQVCAWCHRVRDERGQWTPLDADAAGHASAGLTHGVCPDCYEKQKALVPRGPSPFAAGEADQRDDRDKQGD
jgi:hypothetical protein